MNEEEKKGPRARAYELHAQLVAARPKAVARIKLALHEADGNAVAAARGLGIGLRSMFRLLKDEEIGQYITKIREEARARKDLERAART